MKMASSRVLLLSTLLLRSPCVRRSLFNLVLANFSAAAGNSTGLLDHFRNIHRQSSHLLTASEFAPAIGFFPGCRELLWLQKINGTTDDRDVTEMSTGMAIEYKDCAFDACMNISGMRQYFTARSDLQVNHKNPLYGWMAASVDGIIDNKSYKHDFKYPRSILKIVYTRDFELWSDKASVEMGYRFPNEHNKVTKPWKRIPLYFIPQVQGILDIMDIDKMEFYIWGCTGSSLFSIYRDAEYCNVLKTALSDFWWKHVFPAKEFCTKHKIEDPCCQLRSLKPDPKHDLYHYVVQESKRIADQYIALRIDANGNTLPI